jgi:outer membrane immunogenic protein
MAKKTTLDELGTMIAHVVEHMATKDDLKNLATKDQLVALHTQVSIEGTYSGTTLQGSTTCLLLLECKREVESVATVVGRLGLAMDRSLLYALGGVAWGKVDSDVSIVGINIASDSQNHVGWVAGFGFEHALSRQLSLPIEYSHIDLGSKEHFGFADVDVVLDTVRLGVNYRFN